MLLEPQRCSNHPLFVTAHDSHWNNRGIKGPCYLILAREQFSSLSLFLHLFKTLTYPTLVLCPELCKISESCSRNQSLDIVMQKILLLATMDTTQNLGPEDIAGVYCNINESKIFGQGPSMSSFVDQETQFSLWTPPTYLFAVVVILKNHILKLFTKACCTSQVIHFSHLHFSALIFFLPSRRLPIYT